MEFYVIAKRIMYNDDVNDVNGSYNRIQIVPSLSVRPVINIMRRLSTSGFVCWLLYDLLSVRPVISATSLDFVLLVFSRARLTKGIHHFT